LFAIFGLYPILFSLYLSLVKWDGLTVPKFVGLANFRTLFTDPAFFRAIWNTLLIGIIYIPPMFIGAFLLAVLLNQQALKLRAFWRSILKVRRLLSRCASQCSTFAGQNGWTSKQTYSPYLP